MRLCSEKKLLANVPDQEGVGVPFPLGPRAGADPGFLGSAISRRDHLAARNSQEYILRQYAVLQAYLRPGTTAIHHHQQCPRRLAVVKLEVLFLAGCLHPPHGPIATSRLILQVPSGNRRPPKRGLRQPASTLQGLSDFSGSKAVRRGTFGDTSCPLISPSFQDLLRRMNFTS